MIVKAPQPLTGEIMTDLLAALRADLEHAEQAVAEGAKPHIVAYSTGYRDCIRLVIELVERTRQP